MVDRTESEIVEHDGKDLGRTKKASAGGNSSRFHMAAIGSLPWVGGLMAAAAVLEDRKAAGKASPFQEQWIEEHTRRLDEVARALREMTERIDHLGAAARERVETEEFLGLVRKGMKVWDNSSTAEKRALIIRILTNSAGTQLKSDDVVRLFIDWIEKYHEIHFAVIQEVYKHPGATRKSIWAAIRGKFPRDDSSDADLFKLLIHDLSVGRVIRQHREVNAWGQHLKKAPKPKGSSGGTMKSAFDDEEEYELTELGKEFVHYVLNDAVRRVGGQ